MKSEQLLTLADRLEEPQRSEFLKLMQDADVQHASATRSRKLAWAIYNRRAVAAPKKGGAHD